MVNQITQELADFAVNTQFNYLPASIIEETKQVIMEHIGCGLGALSTDKGKMAVALGKKLGGTAESSILGLGDKVSSSTAVLANGELMIALDYCDNMSFGHDGLFVVPPALAIAESARASGRDLILATAVGLEISSRLARAARWHTLTSEEVRKALSNPPKNKNAHSAFGGTAAAGKLLRLDKEKMTHALGIVSRYIVTSFSTGRPSFKSMNKYVVPGFQNSGAVISAQLAEMGYLGETSALDEPEQLDWNPEHITDKLGKTWIFNQQLHYKPYPCCGGFHSNLDCFYNILEENKLAPEEIKKIKIFGGWGIAPPTKAKKEIEGIYAAQFNQPYTFSLLAHRITRGVEWVDPDTMNNPKILDFMGKVTFAADPDFTEKAQNERIEDPRARPARVEVAARGKLFASEIKFRRGDTFTDMSWTQKDIVEKFRHNAERILTQSKIKGATEALLKLESVNQVSQLVNEITL